jgi:GAF domain-containing protein
MFAARIIESTDKPAFYRELRGQLAALLSGETDPIANAANTSALVFQMMPDLNWAGFYFLQRQDELVLGPFQGKPACVRIAVGRGVCGTAVAQRKSMMVDDVNSFSGHIACDSMSRSELVVPLFRDGEIFGVLDLDSSSLARFDADDRVGVEALATVYVEAST